MKQLKRFYQFILEKPSLFILHVVLFIIATILVNTKPFFIAEITNLAMGGAMENILWVVILFGITMIVSTLILNLSYYIETKNNVRLSTKIVKKVMGRIHDLDFAFHTNKSSGKLLSTFNRGDDAVFVFYEGLNEELLGVVIGLVMMFASFSQLNFRYSLLVVIYVVIMILISRKLLQLNMKKRKIFNGEDDNLSAVKVDNLINFDTVKYFANEKFEQNRLGKVLKKWSKTLNDYFVTFRVFDISVNSLANIFVTLIAVVAFFDLLGGSIDVAQFLFVFTFCINVLPQMTFAMHIARHLAKKSDDFERYLGILDQEITVPDPAMPQKVQHIPGEIVFDGVNFSYHEKNSIISDFNLKIKPGEAVALVGFSGAGKTTIAKLLMRMYDVDGGAITIDGVDVRAMNKDYLRSLVGIVPQEPVMFNNSVYYNIAYSNPDASEKEVLRASKLAQTDGFIGGLSEGYETMVGERGIKLSGGQRQRLAIARVLLQGAQIVIFDEATSSLDSEAEKAVQTAFWQMAKDKKRPVTSIIIAHRLSTIMRADRIVVMDKGTIAEVGTHEELLKKKDSIYGHLWKLQQDGFIGDGE